MCLFKRTMSSNKFFVTENKHAHTHTSTKSAKNRYMKVESTYRSTDWWWLNMHAVLLSPSKGLLHTNPNLWLVNYYYWNEELTERKQIEGTTERERAEREDERAKKNGWKREWMDATRKIHKKWWEKERKSSAFVIETNKVNGKITETM